MSGPKLLLVWELGDGSGFTPGQPSHPIYHPGHPDHGLPSQPGGEHPDQGLPGGRPPHVGNRPPGSGRPPHVGGGPARPGGGAYPDQGLPDGEDVQIDNELPPVPPEYADKTVVAIKRPDEDWIVKAYDPAQVDNSLPQGPEPK